MKLANRINLHVLFDCTIFPFEATSGPNWSAWMEEEMESSEYVILVPTAKYARRGKIAATGVAFELRHITERLRTAERSVICVVFPTVPNAADNLPLAWRSMHRFNIDGQSGSIETLLKRMPGVDETPKVRGDRVLTSPHYEPAMFGAAAARPQVDRVG